MIRIWSSRKRMSIYELFLVEMEISPLVMIMKEHEYTPQSNRSTSSGKDIGWRLGVTFCEWSTMGSEHGDMVLESGWEGRAVGVWSLTGHFNTTVNCYSVNDCSLRGPSFLVSSAIYRNNPMSCSLGHHDEMTGCELFHDCQWLLWQLHDRHNTVRKRKKR